MVLIIIIFMIIIIIIILIMYTLCESNLIISGKINIPRGKILYVHLIIKETLILKTFTLHFRLLSISVGLTGKNNTD